MATQTFNRVSVSASRVPTSGYMTIGMSSGGTNQNATVTMPPLKVNGTINAVKVVISWDNNAANEGFRASATHVVVGTSNCSGSWNYAVSGVSGTVYVPIGSWSTTSNWSFNLRSYTTVRSTSKGCRQQVYVLVEYTEPPPTPTETYVPNMEVFQDIFRRVKNAEVVWEINGQKVYKKVLHAAIWWDGWKELF